MNTTNESQLLSVYEELASLCKYTHPSASQYQKNLFSLVHQFLDRFSLSALASPNQWLGESLLLLEVLVALRSSFSVGQNGEEEEWAVDVRVMDVLDKGVLIGDVDVLRSMEFVFLESLLFGRNDMRVRTTLVEYPGVVAVDRLSEQDDAEDDLEVFVLGVPSVLKDCLETVSFIKNCVQYLPEGLRRDLVNLHREKGASELVETVERIKSQVIDFLFDAAEFSEFHRNLRALLLSDIRFSEKWDTLGDFDQLHYLSKIVERCKFSVSRSELGWKYSYKFQSPSMQLIMERLSGVFSKFPLIFHSIMDLRCIYDAIDSVETRKYFQGKCIPVDEGVLLVRSKLQKIVSTMLDILCHSIHEDFRIFPVIDPKSTISSLESQLDGSVRISKLCLKFQLSNLRKIIYQINCGTTPSDIASYIKVLDDVPNTIFRILPADSRIEEPRFQALLFFVTTYNEAKRKIR